MNLPKTPSLSRAVAFAAMAALLLFVLHPFVWLFLSTFKPEQELMQYPPALLPERYLFDAYVEVWNRIPLLDFFRNTVIFSVSVMVVSVFFDSMAGYAFARIRFKGSKVLFTLVLITMMIPFQVTMIPLFVEVFKLGLLDTYWGLILPRASSAFGIFLMRSFFVSLPKDLENPAASTG